MGMNSGWCDVTLSGGVGTATWRHPAQIAQGMAGADVVELDAAPRFYQGIVTSIVGGNVGHMEYTFTANGVTIESTHGNDQSTVRVFAWVMPPKWFSYQSG